MPCPECGATQLGHDDVGSLVCTSCGTLVDANQTVLADHGGEPNVAHVAPRNSKGWHLAQTKQDRDRKNTIAMSIFIHAILSRLNSPGLSPRAEAIFTQAMAKGHYRWGRKAKRVAGVSIAIALREARKSDSLRDMAFFLDDSTVSLARTFQSVTALLDFSLGATDPAVHLPILHAHLQSLMHPETLSPPPPSQLPKSLVAILSQLSLHTAVRTATSLSQIVSHHSPPLPITTLPTPPTACALLILGLEAETRAPLPHLGELTRALGSRFALASGVVSSRYKIIYDLIEEWIRHVPWLVQFIYEDQKRGTAARAKASKRSVVARGTKDVIQFHEEIWQSRMQSQQKINLDLELDPSDVANQEDEDEDDNESAHTSTVAPSSKRAREPAVASLPGKRRRIEKHKGKKDKAMQVACQRLRDLLSFRSRDAATSNGELSLLTHLLTCPLDELIQGTPPTRLQLLAASRGGSTVEHIADEELFANGELEGVFRSEQEREALRPLFELNWGQETSTSTSMEQPPPAEDHRQPTVAEPKRGAKRVDMDALDRLLRGNDNDDGHPGDSEEDPPGFPDPDDEAYLWDWDGFTDRSSGPLIAREGDEFVGASPDDDDSDIFGEFYNTTEDRYEEEL